MDGKGFFVSLQVTDKTKATISYSLPITLGELAILRSMISFCIPRFLALDCVWDTGAQGTINEFTPPPPPMYKAIDDNNDADLLIY